ncbi:MAG: hypothetical protein HC778_05425 [Chamaesiphon sp. CSU_1_12]|nr:hypothetical protein [Chamaesiphon sp. CSU_1_12]
METKPQEYLFYLLTDQIGVLPVGLGAVNASTTCATFSSVTCSSDIEMFSQIAYTLLISTAKDMPSWKNGELNYGDGRQYFVPDRHLKNFKHSTIEPLNKATRDKIRARFIKPDGSILKPTNENHNSAKIQSKDLLKARLKLKKSGERKNQAASKERFKARYGKPKDAKKNLGKSLREKSKAAPKSTDKSLAKSITPNRSKDPRVARNAESSVAKKTGGTKEKKHLCAMAIKSETKP